MPATFQVKADNPSGAAGKSSFAKPLCIVRWSRQEDTLIYESLLEGAGLSIMAVFESVSYVMTGLIIAVADFEVSGFAKRFAAAF